MELDKTQLQWLLTGVGAVIVVLLYLWVIRSRLKEKIGKRRRRPSLEHEPVLGDAPARASDGGVDGHDFGEQGRITPDHHLADKVLVDVEIRPVDRKAADSPAEAAPIALEPPRELHQESAASLFPDMTVVLTVMAPRSQPFHGPKIRAAAEEARFRLNADGLFEQFADAATLPDTPLFSMAHLRKPGLFEPKSLNDLKTPGLLLFMKLPGPLEGIKALEQMVVTADQLARKLGGLICDEHRNRMTNQALAHLRNEVAELEQRQWMWMQSP